MEPALFLVYNGSYRPHLKEEELLAKRPKLDIQSGPRVQFLRRVGSVDQGRKLDGTEVAVAPYFLQ